MQKRIELAAQQVLESLVWGKMTLKELRRERVAVYESEVRPTAFDSLLTKLEDDGLVAHIGEQFELTAAGRELI